MKGIPLKWRYVAANRFQRLLAGFPLLFHPGEVYLFTVALILLVSVFDKCFDVAQGLFSHNRIYPPIQETYSLYYIGVVRAKLALDNESRAA